MSGTERVLIDYVGIEQRFGGDEDGLHNPQTEMLGKLRG